MQKTDTVDRLLTRAVHLHQTGKIAGAIRLYRNVVEKAPRHAGALNLLGLALHQAGQSESAVPLLQEALTLQPSLPSGHYNLGTVCGA